MTATTDTRKRPREDDGSDSMPLSKRINNLHINNNIGNFNSMNPMSLVHGNGSQDVRLIGDEQRNGFGLHEYSETSRESFFAAAVSSIENSHSNSQHPNECQPDYSPELNQLDNPYYYDKNKLLYELHLERMRRTPQS